MEEKKFDIKIVPTKRENIYDLKITTNGWQWNSQEFTKEQLRSILDKLAELFDVCCI